MFIHPLHCIHNSLTLTKFSTKPSCKRMREYLQRRHKRLRFDIERIYYKNSVCMLFNDMIKIMGNCSRFDQCIRETTFWFHRETSEKHGDVIKLICSHKKASIICRNNNVIPTYKITESNKWRIQCSYWDYVYTFSGTIRIRLNVCS